jgi:hypothetical protein
MKKILFFFSFLFTLPIAAEFHGGVGFAWNTIDETFHSNLHTNEDRSGRDSYETSLNRLAPLVQIGYRYSRCNEWAIGALAQWKFIDYKTHNVSSSRGQILPNASFSSINIFGPEVIRDFTSKTRLKNEVILLGYLGKHIACGYAYLGAGPVFFNASNSIYVSSVHVPNGVGDHLISTSVSKSKAVCGGAVQAGYQYYLCTNSFINISYTYVQTGKTHFKNSANAALLNGADNPGNTTLFLKRSIEFAAQEFMISMNLEF